METQQDTPAFIMAMQRLSTAAIIGELTKERIAVFWDALCDLPIESVTHAAQHAVRYWRPTEDERFFLPATLREYARLWRLDQQGRPTPPRPEGKPLLPQRTDTTDAEGLSAIRDILAKLEAQLAPLGASDEAPTPDELAARRLARKWRRAQRGPYPLEEA